MSNRDQDWWISVAIIGVCVVGILCGYQIGFYGGQRDAESQAPPPEGREVVIITNDIEEITAPLRLDDDQ